MRTLLECYKILEEYPNGMTKDQFYRVARINKQHAKYLLDSGLVPCINTGKKTRKYHIATHDVITYLCDREDNPEKYKVPTGFYIGKKRLLQAALGQACHRDYPTSILQSQKKQGCIPYGKNLTVGYDDLLTTPVVSELTGYSAQSIQRWCNQKILVGFKIRGTLTIPRLAVVEFMSGDRATAIVRKSSKHLDLLRTYAQDCHEGAMTITY